MNLYLRAIGFRSYKSDDEEKMIIKAIQNSINSTAIISNEHYQRSLIPFWTSESTGLAIYVRNSGEDLVYDHHYPYITTDTSKNRGDILIRRNRLTEGFQGVYEDNKVKMPLTFAIANAIDILDYMQYHPFNPDFPYELNGLAATKQIQVKACDVFFTATALSGIVVLPMRKDEEEETNSELFGDLLSFVDTTLMPNGPESESYSITAYIKSVKVEENIITNENIYVMEVIANGIPILLAVNSEDVYGSPRIGMRIRGPIRLSGHIYVGKKGVNID